MQAPGPSAAHRAEWRRNHFAVTSDACTAARKADAYRAQILRIQHAWASAEVSRACAARLFQTYADRYAAVMDSDAPGTGLSNYTEHVFAPAASSPPAGDSGRWRSGLSVSGVLRLGGVQAMMRAGGEAGASAGVPAGPVTVEPHQLRVCAASGDGEPPSEAAPGADRTQNGPGSARLRGPQNAQPPDSPKTCATPLAAAVTQAGSAVLGTSSPADRPPAASGRGSPWAQDAFRGASVIDALAAPALSEAFSRAEADGPRGERGPPAFRTAKEQLWAQQQERRQRAPGSSQGGVKKSLGAARSRGIFGKFVPPVPKRDGGDPHGGVQGKPEAAGPPEPAQPADERLRNLEPKMVELIMNEILDHGPPVSWEDIAGVEFAKATIKEIVVWPMLRPDLFTGLRGPPKGILLFGPPGTGKTLIGKCIASQSGATFFSISAASLTSKWVGEGEKMVRALFAVARCQQPAVIFIDEIDSLLSQRGDGEHESSRRIKTEFLVQLDGATTSSEDRILVVGATNRPQEIDEAARRRLVKRLYIPLPEAPARKQIVTSLMSRERCRLSEDELELVVQQSDGFSGADMTQLCREASLGPIRGLQAADIATITPDQVPPIAYADFENALRTVRPSVSPKDLALYEHWNKTFGSGR